MNRKIIYIYNEPFLQRKQIYKDLKNKSGIYLWTNIINNKQYAGSSINLSRRLKDYFNKYYLQSELKKNNSKIYRALLKYNYLNFKLEILEFCEPNSIIEREQYYLNTLNLNYNILKIARSLNGFKHDDITKKLIAKAHLGKSLSEENKKILYANCGALEVKVFNLKTNEITNYSSIRKAAEFIGIHHSYLAKSLKNKELFLGRGFKVIKHKL